MGSCLVLAWMMLLVTPGLAFAQDCVGRLFCLETEEEEGVVVFYIDNLQPFEITVELDLTLDNATADISLPYRATFPPNRRIKVLTLRQTNPARSWQYRYTSQWRRGSLDARHDETVTYALPFAPGKTHAVVQGFDGSFSHQGLYAVDWQMEERTPIYAARSGVVAEVIYHYSEGGLKERLKDKANRILIRHDDGTLGGYYHLAKNGTFVTVGQRISKGQVLGVSGNTGYSGGAHLHFEVYSLAPDLSRRTIPVRFDLGRAGIGAPTPGKAYTAPLR